MLMDTKTVNFKFQRTETNIIINVHILPIYLNMHIDILPIYHLLCWLSFYEI